VVSSPV